jgi:O-antigen ligase
MKTSLRARLPDRQDFLRLADWLAIGVALSLPWSTSATSILIVLWFLAWLPTLDVGTPPRGRFRRGRLAGAVVGAWGARHALGRGLLGRAVRGLGSFTGSSPFPCCLAQFRGSDRGMLVLGGFLVSATCLLATSWALALTGVTIPGKSPGVPVKDYIFQSGIFLICAFALFGAACDFWRAGKRGIAVAFALLAALFIADIAFVAVSRTVLLVAPLLVIALGYRQFGLKGVLAAGLIAGALGGALWLESSYLRTRIADSMAELRGYLDANTASSTGEHLEFLKSRGASLPTLPSSATVPARSPKNFAAPGAARPAPPALRRSTRTIRFSSSRSSSASSAWPCCWRCGRRISCCSAAPASSPGLA